MRRLLVAATLGVLLLSGCAAQSEESEPAPPAPPPSEQGVDDVLSELERTRPGVVLRDFVRAAARRDEQRMWERLSARTRKRVGPSLRAFRRGAARKLERELGSLGRRHELILSQQITPTFAVAAVRRADKTYAVALRQEAGLWRVELDGRVRMKALRPHPGETVSRRTQVAVEVAAGTAIVEAGLWLDGLALPSRGGALNPRQLTMYTEAPRLRRGPHSVVAFASTESEASAYAWTFRAGG